MDLDLVDLVCQILPQTVVLLVISVVNPLQVDQGPQAHPSLLGDPMGLVVQVLMVLHPIVDLQGLTTSFLVLGHLDLTILARPMGLALVLHMDQWDLMVQSMVLPRTSWTEDLCQCSSRTTKYLK